MQAGAMIHDYSATGTVTHTELVNILAKMGDASGEIIAWVMHSKTYFDLVKQGIADALFEVAGVTVYTGTTATLNRPVIVVDSPDLIDLVPIPDEYRVLGLVSGACTIDESENRDIESDVITGNENIIQRIQGEYAYNIKLKGMKYLVASGANPDDTALALSTNWVDVTAAANAGKGGPGAMGLFQ
jgi:hypothetical protein